MIFLASIEKIKAGRKTINNTTNLAGRQVGRQTNKETSFSILLADS